MLLRGGVFGGGYELGARVKRFGDAGFGLGDSLGLSDGVGQGRGDVEFFGAADHLGGALDVVCVVPDSNNNFRRFGTMHLLLRSARGLHVCAGSAGGVIARVE